MNAWTAIATIVASILMKFGSRGWTKCSGVPANRITVLVNLALDKLATNDWAQLAFRGRYKAYNTFSPAWCEGRSGHRLSRRNGRVIVAKGPLLMMRTTDLGE